MDKLKIFISGTQDDMKPERDAVDHAVNATTLATGIRAETASSQPQSPRAWIEQQLRECNIYIGVYSHRYGWVIPGENVSATEFEFNLARKLRKPILVWIRNRHDEEQTKPDFDWQEQFLKRVSDFSAGYLRQVFDNLADLEKWVTVALGETFTEIIRSGTALTASKFLVPFPHNPDFVGRDTDLATLHAMLQQGNSPVGIRPTVLVGLGGIGKTQLAVEYVHAYRDFYGDGIFWLNAINPLLLEFATLAETLGLADKETPRDDAARKAWAYLDERPNALVIFDNVVEPADLNIPFTQGVVVTNLRCREIFTTRQRDFPKGFQPFEVQVLPEEAAMHLLLRSRREILQTDHPEWGIARIVCASLGWLPLALELAAAYLAEYPEVTLNSYLTRLRTEGKLKTVDDTELRPNDLPTRHEVAVRATLLTQWSRLDDENARYLFLAAGQFPEGTWIPTVRLGLLTGIKASAETGHAAPLSRTIRRLQTISLIQEMTTERLRLHPLVREFASNLASPTFPNELAARMYDALKNIQSLESHITQRGIYAVLEDVRTGLWLCSTGKDSMPVQEGLTAIERVLDRETHNLRDWDSERYPNLFAQLVRIRAFDFDLPGIAQDAEVRLQLLHQPYLTPLWRAGPESLVLIRTLIGHVGRVYAVAISADGRFAVSASYDHSVKVWDIRSGQEIRTLLGHSDHVQGIALTSDDRWAISASRDGTLKVWDLQTGQEVRTLSGHTGRVNTVAVIPGDQLVISGSSDHTLKIWDLFTGQQIRTLAGHAAEVYGVAVTRDGQHAISASGDHSLKVWNLMTGVEEKSLNGHKDNVQSVAVTPDDQSVVSASEDKTLILWDLRTGSEIRTLAGHVSGVLSVVITPDGRRVISASTDHTLIVWELQSGEKLRTLAGHTNRVRGVAISPDGRYVVSASCDGTLKVWNLEVGQRGNTQAGHRDWVRSIAITRDDKYVVSSSSDRTLEMWDIKTGHKVRTFLGHEADVRDVMVTPDGEFVLSGSNDRTIRMWNLNTGEQVRIFTGHSDVVRALAVTHDRKLMVSGSFDRTIKLWELATGKMLRTFPGHTDLVRSLAVTSDGYYIVSSSNDRTIRIWELHSGKEIRSFEAHEGDVREVLITPDDRFIISAGNDHTLKVWEFQTGLLIRTLLGHQHYVGAAVLTEDGRLVISVSDDRTLRIWDWNNAETLAMVTLEGILLCVAVSPDNKVIAVGDGAGNVYCFRYIISAPS